MKKKLNLLWNLKFNFFSVAERPLTFFAYFLNAKKVGRRRLVIVPATAGGLPLFPHAASAFTPALAPVRSHFACGETGLAGYRPHLLGLPRKIARGISLRETTLCGCPLRGHGFATPHRYFAVPVTPAPRRVPNGKTPALAPIRSHFTPRNRAAGYRPHLLGLPRKIGRGISLRETTLGGRPLRGHGFAAPHRPFPLPAAAAPTTA